MTNDLHGGSAPNPPEFSALGESRGAGKKKGGKHKPRPSIIPRLGARVALQRCPILRADESSYHGVTGSEGRGKTDEIKNLDADCIIG